MFDLYNLTKRIPMETIKLSELQDGYLLFLNGTSFLAKGIKMFQRWKFGKNSPYYLNHVGFLVKTKDDQWLVYEQDHPGRFQGSSFDDEYTKDRGDIYIGIPKKELGEWELTDLRIHARKIAGEDVLLNYSYKSYFGFIFDTISTRLFKKEFWLTGKPKGSTCSQVVAKLYQLYFNMFRSNDWWKFYPSELAMSKEIEIRKLVY